MPPASISPFDLGALAEHDHRVGIGEVGGDDRHGEISEKRFSRPAVVLIAAETIVADPLAVDETLPLEELDRPPHLASCPPFESASAGAEIARTANPCSANSRPNS